MQDNGDAATVMLGLSGFRLLSVSVRDGEIEQAVETVQDAVGCPDCAVVARLHDRRAELAHDLPAAGRPVTIVWVKRGWRCRERMCARQTWTETSGPHSGSGFVDRARPGRGVSPGRAGRSLGDCGGQGLRLRLVDGDVGSA